MYFKPVLTISGTPAQTNNVNNLFILCILLYQKNPALRDSPLFYLINDIIFFLLRQSFSIELLFLLRQYFVQNIRQRNHSIFRFLQGIGLGSHLH